MLLSNLDENPTRYRRNRRSIARVRAENDLQHVEIPLVIPNIMVPAGEGAMLQQRLFRHDQWPEKQVGVVKNNR